MARFGDFLNFFATDFITEAAQMFGGFWAVVEKHCFSSQTGKATFWETFGETWATFYSTSGDTGKRTLKFVQTVCC